MGEKQYDSGKREVPPPSLRKGPAEPPPPSVITGSAGSPPPPPSPSASSPPSAAASAASPIKVRVKPDREGEGDEGSSEEKPLVSLGTRVGAVLIDYAVALGLYLAALFVLPEFLDSAASLLAAAYIVLRDGLPFLNGQSVGKTAMKIRAVTRDGESLAGNWQPAVVRNVALLLFPVFPLIELIVLLTREDKPDQGVRLGDEWAKTMVVPVTPAGGGEDDDQEDGNRS